jgi:hypothetical protein
VVNPSTWGKPEHNVTSGFAGRSRIKVRGSIHRCTVRWQAPDETVGVPLRYEGGVGGPFLH